jgi:hypothetical protein
VVWLDALWQVLAFAPVVLAVGFAIVAVGQARRVPLTASTRPAAPRADAPRSAPPPVARAADPDAPGHSRPRAPSAVRAVA